ARRNRLARDPRTGRPASVIRVGVKRLDPSVPLPTYARHGDAGLDLCAAHDVTLPPGGRALVGTGLAVAIPPGHAGFVLPRSGLALKRGVTILNAPGLIDAGYRGELKVLLVNHDAEDRPRWRVHMRLLIRKLPPRRERSRLLETTSLPPALTPSHPLHGTAARGDSTTTDSDYRPGHAVLWSEGCKNSWQVCFSSSVSRKTSAWRRIGRPRHSTVSPRASPRSWP